jgi:outer membrane immunogenic protein
MKKSPILVATFIALAAGSAKSADLPVKAPPAYKVPTTSLTYNWTGFYVGGNVGYGWGHNDPGPIDFYSPVGVFAGSIPGISSKTQGVIGGGQAGYNQQFGNMVLGLEGDISGTGIKGSVTDTINGYTATSNIDWLATGRGRAGVVFGRTLVYGTGGVAVASVKIKLDDSYPPVVVSTTSTQTHVGWTAGAGVEMAIWSNFSLRAEYLYVDLGTKQYNHYEPSPPGWPQISYNNSVKANIVRVGLNYMFGAPKY